MLDDKFAFILPAVMAAFGFAFLFALRWDRQTAWLWALGLFSAALGFVLPVVPIPPIVGALLSNALFLIAMLAYGEALCRRFATPSHFAWRLALAVGAYGAIAANIVLGDLKGELMLGDFACVVLLAWPIVLVFSRVRKPLEIALVAVMALIALDSGVRVVAISWLVTSGAPLDTYLNSPYAQLSQSTAGVIVAIFSLVALANIVVDVIERFRDDAERDPLTGLYNRRGFTRIAETMDPGLYDIALIQCDLDHFKQVNDTFGHAAGDRALQMAGQLICEHIPKTASVGRFGGEEFVVLVPDMRLTEAGILAHRLRLAFIAMDWRDAGIEGQLTASFGVAQWSAGDRSLSGALARGDAALYAAKAAGRNQVFLELRHQPDISDSAA